MLDAFGTPDGLAARSVLLALAFPVLAAGIAAYLGSHTGAGPTEAAALAWDPPVPFRWSYSLVQGGGGGAGGGEDPKIPPIGRSFLPEPLPRQSGADRVCSFSQAGI